MDDESTRGLVRQPRLVYSHNMTDAHVDDADPDLKRNDWRTPDPLWNEFDVEYQFNLDVAACATNAKCANFYDGLSLERDALLQARWSVADGAPVRAWMNCPYGPKGAVEMWLRKALEQRKFGVFSAALIPMATSRAWFNDLVAPYAEWHTFRGRIAFEDPVPGASRKNPKQDNLLVIYDPQSSVIGHTAIRDSKTGKRLWTHPAITITPPRQLSEVWYV